MYEDDFVTGAVNEFKKSKSDSSVYHARGL